MDDQLKRMLNDKLGGLRAADLLPDFDQGQLWRSIEEELGAEKPPRRAIPVWRYAVAAALAGILIGGFGTRFLSKTQGGSSITVIGQRFDTAGPAAIAADAVPVRPKGIPPIQVPAKAPPRRNRIAAPTISIAGIQQKPASQRTISSRAQPVIQQPAPAMQQPEQIAAAAQVRRKPRARHILDIDVQSRTAVLNEELRTPGKPDLLEVITVRTMLEPGARQAPSSVFRHP